MCLFFLFFNPFAVGDRIFYPCIDKCISDYHFLLKKQLGVFLFVASCGTLLPTYRNSQITEKKDKKNKTSVLDLKCGKNVEQPWLFVTTYLWRIFTSSSSGMFSLTSFFGTPKKKKRTNVLLSVRAALLWSPWQLHHQHNVLPNMADK